MITEIDGKMHVWSLSDASQTMVRQSHLAIGSPTPLRAESLAKQGLEYLKRSTFIMVHIKKNWGGGGVCVLVMPTFCQGDLSAPCVSLALGAKIISWRAITSL